MRWPTLLLAAVAVLFVCVFSRTVSFASSTPGQEAGTNAQADRGTEYTGSAACERCHESEYDSWKRTLHIQMTKPIAEAKVLGDFSAGTHLQQYGRSYTMETRDGHYFITVVNGKRPPERFEIQYTLGARRFQGYLSRLPDGRVYVLPVFWHNESKRWLDYKEITPVPDDPDHDLRQIWNVTCVNCHATNLVKHFNNTADTYATTWTEMGIGCEACHGPGRAHITLMSDWEKRPDSKPAYDRSSSNRQLGETLKIFSPRTASPRQVFDTCGYCHGNKNNVFFGFKSGDRYEDYALPFLISDPIPPNDPQGEFWPDGRPSRFNRPQALTMTGCFQKGQATCTSCHRMHGAGNDHALKTQVEAPGGGHTRQSDLLCTQCHTKGFDEPAHTHHAPESQGSRCVECHMSNVNWRLLNRRRDHTFQPPVPEMTARFGVPNACTTCHEDKSPEWAAAAMNTWYGEANRTRRQATVDMADSIYRAGTGDTTVLPEMARLAVDRTHGRLIRASAAEFAGQLIAKSMAPGSHAGATSQPPVTTPAIVNSLVGAASDPEAVVRAQAVNSLGLLEDPLVVPVVASRLTDPARVVRVIAARALFNRGVVSLEGAVGSRLARAQDEWAESLRTFDDVAADHTTLGWLDAARGKSDDAVKELSIGARLDATDARPHVYLGVIAARSARFDDAAREFRTAKSLSPTYPNIDRLIAEAEKRR